MTPEEIKALETWREHLPATVDFYALAPSEKEREILRMLEDTHSGIARGEIDPTTLLHRTLKLRADQHVPESEETARMFGKRGAK